jgi:hypothetical protein
MKVYATLTNIYDKPAKDLQFEVLNELKDLSSRCDSNCLKHTRFVFECDNTPLDEQEDRAYSLRADEVAVRATFSGSKSVHVIFQFEDALEDVCKEHYKDIWAACNKLFFNNEADTACANPARLTRRPGAIRDNGVEQKLLYNMPENVIEKDSCLFKCIWRAVRALLASRIVTNTSGVRNDHKTFSKNHDGLCQNYDVVQYYLKKSFPNIKGNGDSSISLFKAVRCCMKYGDKTTLESVLRKARDERWSEQELDHLIRNMSKYI